jgi:hypothetical protein
MTWRSLHLRFTMRDHVASIPLPSLFPAIASRRVCGGCADVPVAQDSQKGVCGARWRVGIPLSHYVTFEALAPPIRCLLLLTVAIAAFSILFRSTSNPRAKLCSPCVPQVSEI